MENGRLFLENPWCDCGRIPPLLSHNSESVTSGPVLLAPPFKNFNFNSIFKTEGNSKYSINLKTLLMNNGRLFLENPWCDCGGISPLSTHNSESVTSGPVLLAPLFQISTLIRYLRGKYLK